MRIERNPAQSRRNPPTDVAERRFRPRNPRFSPVEVVWVVINVLYRLRDHSPDDRSKDNDDHSAESEPDEEPYVNAH